MSRDPSRESSPNPNLSFHVNQLEYLSTDLDDMKIRLGHVLGFLEIYKNLESIPIFEIKPRLELLESLKNNYEVKRTAAVYVDHIISEFVTKFKFFSIEWYLVMAQLLTSLVRQKFWPLSAKSFAKQYVRACIACFRTRPQSST